jgi:phosphoglycolate phosphatase-like HAD superfamily hydrolase
MHRKTLTDAAEPALLDALTTAQIPWAIATSGRLETAGPVLETLGVDLERTPVVTRDQVKYASPSPTCSSPRRTDCESESRQRR